MWRPMQVISRQLRSPDIQTQRPPDHFPRTIFPRPLRWQRLMVDVTDLFAGVDMAGFYRPIDG
jgi:hypothetical protein